MVPYGLKDYIVALLAEWADVASLDFCSSGQLEFAAVFTYERSKSFIKLRLSYFN